MNNYCTGFAEIERTQSTLVGILLQEVSSDVDEGTRPAVVGKLGNESFGLLNEAFEGCGGRFT
jgi:hypothetical protein